MWVKCGKLSAIHNSLKNNDLAHAGHPPLQVP